jgi:hypothetical protein
MSKPVNISEYAMDFSHTIANCDWLKVKCATLREANKERWRLFERPR